MKNKYVPPILIQKEQLGKEELSCFARYKDDFLEKVIKDNITSAKEIIKESEKKYNSQTTKEKSKERFIAEEVKKKIKENQEALSCYYAIDILARLEVLEVYLIDRLDGQKTANPILMQLNRRKFFHYNRVELYLFYLIFSHFEINDLRKNYFLIFKHVFNNINTIQFGLKELSKNIIEHTQRGIGVIAVRVYKKGEIDSLRNFGEGYVNWKNTYKKEYSSFLDVNVIDAGEIGLREQYKLTIEKEIKIYETERVKYDNNIIPDLIEALEKDLSDINNKNHAFPSFFITKSREEVLSHQKMRGNARIGLRTFATLVCDKNKGKGIVKMSSTHNGQQSTSEGCCFSAGTTENTFQQSLLKEDNLSFVMFGTNYNFILPVINKASKLPSNELETKKENFREEGVDTSLLCKLMEYEKISYNEIAIKKQPKGKYSVVEFAETNSSDKYIKVIDIVSRANSVDSCI